MINKPKTIGSFQFSRQNRFLLDTNIWMYLYGPNPPNDPYVQRYSDALKRILDAGCRIYINLLIVSEFINAYSRAQWRIQLKQWQGMQDPRFQQFEDFKKFRNSPYFEAIASVISIEVRALLNTCECIEHEYSKHEIHSVLNDFATGKFDFNDQLLSEFCRKKELIFVTHDSDFKNVDIPVLTANKKLLA